MNKMTGTIAAFAVALTSGTALAQTESGFGTAEVAAYGGTHWQIERVGGEVFDPSQTRLSKMGDHVYVYTECSMLEMTLRETEDRFTFSLTDSSNTLPGCADDIAERDARLSTFFSNAASVGHNDVGGLTITTSSGEVLVAKQAAAP